MFAGWDYAVSASTQPPAGSLQRHCLAQTPSHERRTSDTQSLMSKRSSSEVSAVCLKPGNAHTNKCAALSVVQELSSGFFGAIEVRCPSMRLSNLRDP